METTTTSRLGYDFDFRGEMVSVKKAFFYLWDIKNKKIERLEAEAIHPYAKVFDKVFNNPLVGIRRLAPRHKKNV